MGTKETKSEVLYTLVTPDMKRRTINAAKRATRKERETVSESEFVRRAVRKALAVSERKAAK